jgi:uncharacterized protein (TIGR00369 family)
MEKKFVGSDSNCFACGENNKDGLHLKFAKLEDSVEAFFVPEKKFEGWDNIIHGGIVSTLLDEAMSHAIFKFMDVTVVTAEMTVRFIRPLRVGRNIRITGKIEADKGRILETVAVIYDLDDGEKIVAKSTGRFVRVKLD